MTRVALAMVLLAAACTSTRVSQEAFERAVAKAQDARMSVAEVDAKVRGMTRRSYDNGHGTQISYLAADGSYHFWYPGNLRIIHGQWKLAEQYVFVGMQRFRKGLFTSTGTFESEEAALSHETCTEAYRCMAVPVAAICYRYDVRTFNRVTDEVSDPETFDCRRWELEAQYYQEFVEGDVLELASTSWAPFSLSRDPTTVAELAMKIHAKTGRQEGQ